MAPASLRQLDVGNAQLTATGAAKLASANGLRELRALNVAVNDLGARGVRALADASFDKMARLSVGYTMKGDIAPLFEDAWLPCSGERATYERRLEPSGAPAPRGPKRKARAKAEVAGEPDARPFDPTAAYREGDRIVHPEHGPGVVTEVHPLFLEATYKGVGKVRSPLVPAGAIPYEPRRRYRTGDVVLHAKFGAGIVGTAGADRMELDFGLGGKKTLLHGKAS